MAETRYTTPEDTYNAICEVLNFDAHVEKHEARDRIMKIIRYQVNDTEVGRPAPFNNYEVKCGLNLAGIQDEPKRAIMARLFGYEI